MVTVALFPTYDAPKYTYGYQILIMFGGLAIAGSALLYVLQDRREKEVVEGENT